MSLEISSILKLIKLHILCGHILHIVNIFIYFSLNFSMEH